MKGTVKLGGLTVGIDIEAWEEDKEVEAAIAQLEQVLGRLAARQLERTIAHMKQAIEQDQQQTGKL